MKTLVLFVLAAGCMAAQPFSVTDIFQFEEYQPSYCSYPQGAFPNSLMQAADHKLYGTTLKGSSDPFCEQGQYGPAFGTVFDVTTDGTFSSPFSFPGDLPDKIYIDGEYPYSSLVQWKDGKLYGTAQNGGLYYTSQGTLYELSTAGTLNVLHDFCFEIGCADGEFPLGNVVFGSDGTLYGSTTGGGFGFGIIYSYSKGVLRSLHLLSELEGAGPNGLMWASDGNLYGTAGAGGTYALGTLFRVTTAGAFTVLHNFGDVSTDGVGPSGQLTQAANGLLYGTTVGSYTALQNKGGTVFSVDLNGNYKKIFDFAHIPPARPNTLMQASDGFLYGTAGIAGVPGWVFRMDVNGGSFHAVQMGPLDLFPTGALVQGIDGKLYGVAQGDLSTYPGTSTGTVFAVNARAPAPQPSITLFGPVSGPVGTSVTVIGNYFFNITTVEFNGVAATIKAVVPGYLTATAPAGATSGPITIKTAGTSVTSAQVFTVTP